MHCIHGYPHTLDCPYCFTVYEHYTSETHPMADPDHWDDEYSLTPEELERDAWIDYVEQVTAVYTISTYADLNEIPF